MQPSLDQTALAGLACKPIALISLKYSAASGMDCLHKRLFTPVLAVSTARGHMLMEDQLCKVAQL